MDRVLTPLPKLLDALNRKERFWLLRQAVGQPFDGLSSEFRQQLGATLFEDEDHVPENAWWAFDYHLDWIAVALRLLAEGRTLESDGTERVGNDLGEATDWEEFAGRPLVRGNQQDADLLVAYGTSLIVVEAKAGTSWTRSQMDGKIERLDELKALADRIDIEMRLVLCSPGTSNVNVRRDEKGSVWPEWALRDGNAYHVPLAFGEKGRRLFHPKRTEPRDGGYDAIEFVRSDRPVTDD